jgi:hypothetical protein
MMNDIFISYANGDRAVAQKLADALEALGWSVWWDREIPFGKPFDQVIEEELNAARCVIVLWSQESVRSRWVKTEAGAAADRDRLMPVLIEDVAIPLEFKRIQTAMLQGWNGDRDVPEYARLVSSIRQMLGEPASPPSPTARRNYPTSTPPFAHGKRIAIGAGAVVLALLLVILAKTMFHSGERGSSSASTDGASSSGSPIKSGSGERSGATGASSTAGTSKPVKGAFAIKIGDRIDDGVPAPSAGNIETPGAKDVYTFTAAPRQRVYFRKFSHGKDMEQIGWTLADADGAEIFDMRLYEEPGAQLLRRGGTYTMTVGSERVPATGTYHLQLFDIPASKTFPIRIGDKIKEDVPGPGAGRIESPGAKSLYTFAAAAGQRVYFRKFDHEKGMEQISWKLADPEGTDVFDARLYEEPGVQLLRKAGTYTLTIGSDRVPATGGYHLQLFNVPPPHQFGIKIGDTIKENMPGPGAGNIESPGAKDVYTFSAAPGQTVFFRKLGHDPGMEQISLKLADADGTEVFDSRLYEEPGAKVLRKGGTYTLTVGSDRVPATGTYRLQLSSVGG